MLWNVKILINQMSLGLPTLDLGIPGRPPFPSLPSPPSFSPPLPPSRSPWAPPLNQLEGLGERCKLPQWVWVWGNSVDKALGCKLRGMSERQQPRAKNIAHANGMDPK